MCSSKLSKQQQVILESSQQGKAKNSLLEAYQGLGALTQGLETKEVPLSRLVNLAKGESPGRV